MVSTDTSAWRASSSTLIFIVIILGAIAPAVRRGRMEGMDRWADACATLSAADVDMAAAIAGLGPCRLVQGRTAGGAFGALARSICFQQLAGAAASAIHGRFAALYDGA